MNGSDDGELLFARLVELVGLESSSARLLVPFLDDIVSFLLLCLFLLFVGELVS